MEIMYCTSHSFAFCYLHACDCLCIIILSDFKCMQCMLVQGNNRMIYAWSADGNDPADEDSVMYHMSNRGTQGVVFVEDNEVVSDLANAESVTFLANDVSCIIEIVKVCIL